MLRQPQCATGSGGSAVLRANRRRSVQAGRVPHLQLGVVLPGTARGSARALLESVVVYGRILGRAAADDGRVLGGAGVVAGKRVTLAWFFIGRDEDRIRARIG